MTTHTPGPWRVDTDKRFVVDAHGRSIFGALGSVDESECEPNARLIAHAWAIPMLVEALEHLEQRIHVLGIPSADKVTRAAIVQAQATLRLVEDNNI